MGKHHGHGLQLLMAFACAFLGLLLFYVFCFYFRRRAAPKGRSLEDAASGAEAEEALIRFAGGEDLTARDILDAPGEVVAKSSHATLYRAVLRRGDTPALLRFVQPDSAARTEDVLPAVRRLGAVRRHPNLVPLTAMYLGPRGEKLLVHPFYAAGNLAQFIREGVSEAHSWIIIFKLSCGIARGLDHLHNGHATAQAMLDASAAQGYTAPELSKISDSSPATDIYSFGVVLLEMITRKDPLDNKFLQKDLHLPSSLRILVLEHKLSDVFSSKLQKESVHQNSTNEEGLLMLFQLAMACCSPSPNLRPDIKVVIKRLEDIGR
ncbi:putative kinase-like protein TMKL1 isoform X2 [Zingiber officinale]|uniref:putative kinase-like protein TMKL1 isoform X2 n=1 Tax=Zingiber officinale TaxID=94328 RepID=UPI001C4C1C02|nr:putative kinase-like protein TMKL1 isoform X2 [Zingiber officinale]